MPALELRGPDLKGALAGAGHFIFMDLHLFRRVFMPDTQGDILKQVMEKCPGADEALVALIMGVVVGTQMKALEELEAEQRLGQESRSE